MREASVFEDLDGDRGRPTMPKKPLFSRMVEKGKEQAKAGMSFARAKVKEKVEFQRKLAGERKKGYQQESLRQARIQGKARAKGGRFGSGLASVKAKPEEEDYGYLGTRKRQRNERFGGFL